MNAATTEDYAPVQTARAVYLTALAVWANRPYDNQLDEKRSIEWRTYRAAERTYEDALRAYYSQRGDRP